MGSIVRAPHGNPENFWVELLGFVARGPKAESGDLCKRTLTYRFAAILQGLGFCTEQNAKSGQLLGSIAQGQIRRREISEGELKHVVFLRGLLDLAPGLKLFGPLDLGSWTVARGLSLLDLRSWTAAPGPTLLGCGSWT